MALTQARLIQRTDEIARTSNVARQAGQRPLCQRIGH